MDDSPSLTPSFALGKVGFLKDFFIGGSITTVGTVSIFGTVDVSGLEIEGLPTPVFENVHLEGETVVEGPIIFEDDAIFMDQLDATDAISFFGDQFWTDGSAVDVDGNVSFVGGGTIDFGGINVINLPPPTFTDVTLLGNTTVDGPAQFNDDANFATGTVLTTDDQIWNGDTIGVPNAMTIIGAGSLDFQVDVALSGNTTSNGPFTFNDDATFSPGTTLTTDEQVWNGSTITVAGMVSFVGGGTIDFGGVTLQNLPPPSFTDVTLLGNTTVDGPAQFNGNATFANGTTLTMDEQVWNGATISVPGAVAVSGVGSVSFSGLSSVTFGTTTFTGPLVANGTATFNNTVNVTGTTDLDGDLSVGGQSVFAGDVTIDPAADFTVENQFWTGATSSINVAGDVSFVGALGASLSFASIDVTGLHDLTLTGATTIAGTSLNVTSSTFGIGSGTVINSSSTSTATFASTLTTPGVILTPKAAGAATELWANSATGNTLRYDSGCVLVDPSSSAVNNIPVYTGTAGQVDSVQTATLANLNRGLQLNLQVSATSGYNMTGLAGARITNNFLNVNSGGSRGISINLGENTGVRRWELAYDPSLTATADFALRTNNGATTAIYCAESALVTTPVGHVSPFYTLTGTAASPGANSFWLNNAANTRPSWSASGQLALLSDVTGVTPTTFSGSSVPTSYPSANPATHFYSFVLVSGAVTMSIRTLSTETATSAATPIGFPAGTIPAAFRPVSQSPVIASCILDNTAPSIGLARFFNDGSMTFIPPGGGWTIGGGAVGITYTSACYVVM